MVSWGHWHFLAAQHIPDERELMWLENSLGLGFQRTRGMLEPEKWSGVHALSL
jgi:hypothetical protein